ncbi:MAG: cysteine--tRNA ligase [Rikenellaceae bacterium]|nr:cysteine--tRNA ligase [Rikenellaceae bacterium]
MIFKIFNTLSRTKEDFTPLAPPHVGLYVCGPTVYGDPHLGHARPAVTYDLLFRLLMALGYKVRYVRNITDVGHLEHDSDDGEDKLQKKARLEKLEPMEVAQYYTNRYREAMNMLGVLPPSIEPQASGHIIEQIELIKEILEAGYAYQSNGSVYFDVDRYNADHCYGKLSGRSVEEMLSVTRQLDGSGDKRKSYDFALWKKASPEHIMRWPSPWSDGFPGWHLECSAMSRKYLGDRFDIHGGGMDLMFPHHECEIAQSTASMGHEAVRYWMHNNMITIDGRKMGKSLGNFITLEELFTGRNTLLEKAYSPMTIRFFILQAHYRSTLDFSNEALSAAEKGFERLMAAFDMIDKIKPAEKSTVDVSAIKSQCMEALCDDLNSPVAIAVLFEWVKVINRLNDGADTVTDGDLRSLSEQFRFVVCDLLGLSAEKRGDGELTSGLIEMILQVRQQAKEQKNWAVSDKIRDELSRLGVVVKDRKDGADWELK